MSRTFVVTGTDTDVGKTVFAAGLCGLIGARYWKPVQAGAPADSHTDAARNRRSHCAVSVMAAPREA